MKEIITSLLILIFILNTLEAQYGVRLKYGSQSGDLLDFTSETFNSTSDVQPSNFEVGVDYWIKPWDKRIEFTPELAFGRSTFDESGNALNSSTFSFILNTRIYPMDFGSDCDCPTFSKDGTFVSKGFYLELSPGISLHQNAFETSSWPQERAQFSSTSNQLAPRVGIGAGIDIGVSNFLTINPFISYNLIAQNDFIDLLTEANDSLDVADQESDMRQFFFGLRFSFRPNYDPFKR